MLPFLLWLPLLSFTLIVIVTHYAPYIVIRLARCGNGASIAPPQKFVVPPRCRHRLKEKAKFFPAHAMKAYGVSRSITPLILNLSTRWRQLVRFTPRRLEPPAPGKETR